MSNFEFLIVIPVKKLAEAYVALSPICTKGLSDIEVSSSKVN